MVNMEWLGFFSFCFLLARIHGNLTLVAQPTILHAHVDSQLNLSCSLTPDSSEVNRVMVIQIEKVKGTDREPLVSVARGERARLNTDFAGKEATADGLISVGSPQDSFLRLTVLQPDNVDTGEYVCVMSFFDHSFLLKRSEAKATVSASHSVSTPDKDRNNGSNIGLLLVQELQKLRDQLASLTYQLQSSNTTMSSSSTYSSSSSSSFSSSSVPPSFSDTRKAVVFSAQPEFQRLFEEDHLKFDQVSVNIGNAYDAGDSTFTAPYNGSYVFTAAVSLTESKAITELKVNGVSKAQLATQGDDQSSVSLVLELQAGDRVWLQGIHTTSNTTAIFADSDSVFSGFLLQAFE